MNFEQTYERRMLAQSISRLGAECCTGTDRFKPSAMQVGRAFERATWQRFCELGAVGALFAPDVDGLGGDGADLACVFEALGNRLVVELPFVGALMAGRALHACGGEPAKALIRKMLDGEDVGALAYSEADAHGDPHRVGTHAIEDGSGFVLDGAKIAILGGAAADFLVVSARVGGQRGGDHAEHALFVVWSDAPGVHLRGYQELGGGHAADLFLDNVRLGRDALLARGSEAEQAVESALSGGVLALCAQAVGAMETLMALTIEYLKTRRQFGQPIASFQAIQHRVVELLLATERSRSALINAMAGFDSPGPGRDQVVAAAKVTIGEAATLLAEDCIQLHGGIGMTWELPAAHYAKWLALVNFSLGDDDNHLRRYVASRSREAWQKEGAQ